MKRKMYWGISTFIILLIGTLVFIIQKDRREIQKLQSDLDAATELLANHNDQKQQKTNDRISLEMIAAQNYANKPNDGKEYEWRGDHWYRVPNPESPRLVDMEYNRDILKPEIPDKLPDDFPTDVELQQMTYEQVIGLNIAYLRKYNDMYKTDSDGAVKFHNEIMPRLWARMDEIRDEIKKSSMESNSRTIADLPIRLPQTEESPAVIIEVEKGVNQ